MDKECMRVKQCHFGGKLRRCRHFCYKLLWEGRTGETSPGNVRDLVFLESGKGFAIIQNNYVKFVAHKESNGASWDVSLLSTSIKKKKKT